MSHPQANKRAKEKFGDVDAFRLLAAMVGDLEGSVPKEIHDFILGRIRSRDYEFVVKLFPSSVLSLMHRDVAKGGVTLSIAGKEFELGPNPVQTVQLLYVASNFLKKYPFRDSPEYTDQYRRDNARRSFRKAEKWCYLVNRHLHLSDFVENEAKRIIRWLLGEAPDIEAVIGNSYFGPGVNVGIKGDQTDPQFKFSLDLTITRSLRKQLNAVMDLMPGTLAHFGLRHLLQSGEDDQVFDFDLDFSYRNRSAFDRRYERLIALGAMDLLKNRLKDVPGEVGAWVPKTALTYRGISKQPLANSYFQNGTGKTMEQRLARKTVALDLHSQERNQELADIGCKTGELATIDLSSASDTISMAIVKLLLPKKWYNLLRLLRSPYYTEKVDGKWVTKKLNRFSSMGNGFTFPLEAAIFYALSRAAIVEQLVTRENFTLEDARLYVQPLEGGLGVLEPSVYGDDIVVPTRYYESVTSVLNDAGFWINRDKSYHTGPFRESCGHDYHYGCYVRPLFLSEVVSCPIQLNTLINHLLNPTGLGWVSKRYGISFRRLFTACLSTFTKDGRFQGEVRYGPITGITEPLFLVRDLDALRANGHIFEDQDRQRWVFDPLNVVVRKYDDVSSFGKMMKSYHRMRHPSTEPVFSNNLKTLVKRGEVTVRNPKRSTLSKRLESLPSVELGKIPENLSSWLENLARYADLYPKPHRGRDKVKR